MMTTEPRSEISAVSEPVEHREFDTLHHFVAAVGWAIPGGIVPLLMGLFVLEPFGISEAIFTTSILVLIVTVFAVLGMFFVALPLTKILSHLRAESLLAYALCGAIAGALLVGITFEIWRWGGLFSLILTGSGAIAGLASGIRWGLGRTTS